MFARGVLRATRPVGLHLAEADVIAGLKKNFKVTDAEIARNQALIASCIKTYTKPITQGHSEDLSEAEIQKVLPRLEAFYRPNKVLQSAHEYVMPQDRTSFGDFASKELLSAHFKYFVVGWGLAIVLVTGLGLSMTNELADDSAFIKSIRKSQGILLKEDRDRLAHNSHGDHH